MLARLVTVMLSAGLGVVGMVSAAHAVPTECQTRDSYGTCQITVENPGTSGRGGSSGKNDGGSRGGSAGPKSPALMRTVRGQECIYLGRVTPQPPKTEEVWEGRANGAIHECVYKLGGTFSGTQTLMYWAAAGSDAAVDPRVLADRAVRAMNLQAVGIGIVPEDGPGRVGIIGMPTWMWVANPNDRTVGPISRSASSGGATVTANASLSRIVWDMGDGKKVPCAGRGTPYADSFGKQSSPTCGHTYTRPGKYTVTATSFWTVNWSGMGQAGTIPLTFSETTTITMGEAQVLVQ